MSVQTPYNAQSTKLTTAGGQLSSLNLAAGANLVKAGVGRVMRLSVTVAGTAGTFSVNDAATTGAAAAANLIWEGSATSAQGTIVDLEFPYSSGLVVTVPTGGTVSVSYV